MGEGYGVDGRCRIGNESTPVDVHGGMRRLSHREASSLVTCNVLKKAASRGRRLVFALFCSFFFFFFPSLQVTFKVGSVPPEQAPPTPPRLLTQAPKGVAPFRF